MCIVGMTGLIIWSLLSSMSYGFDIQQSIFKFVTGVFLGLPATYFAKESNRHRLRQHRLHEVMIELNTINAFVKDLPLEEQVRIKGEFAIKLFGKENGDSSVVNVLPDNSLQLLSEILAKFDFKKN